MNAKIEKELKAISNEIEEAQVELIQAALDYEKRRKAASVKLSLASSALAGLAAGVSELSPHKPG